VGDTVGLRGASIEIQGLRVWFGPREVIKGVSLSIPSNTVFTIMGPSGSGKSTLLRAINRILDLYPEVRVEGRVIVDGLDIYSDSADPSSVRRMIGMVF
jgi:phosphate transport system ATP-binding protein